ncbi:ABC transporter ATP-binding protein [Chloroflexota bacterium]
MVEVKGLSFSYQPKTPIFADFSWGAAPGERWAVIGPSGCGKTTLLYLLAGLWFPASGSVSINGSPLTGPRLATGLILQDYGLLPWATAFENISLGLKIRHRDKTETRQVTEGWLSRLGINTVSHHYPAELSGGQRQRVAIARTLALEPDLLLMDEPFASLDALTREELQGLITGLWENSPPTMILVTHNIEEAVFLGKKIMVLDHPPNTGPNIIDNREAGHSDYRLTAAFIRKCREVRKLVERSISS